MNDTRTTTLAPGAMEHFTIYRNAREFCSWPFNGGMWKLKNEELLVAFVKTPCDYSVAANLRHTRIETFGKLAAARSSDGGASWGEPEPIADQIQLSDDLVYGKPGNYSTPYDFSDPDTIISCFSTPNTADPNAKAWIRISGDGGRNWGPAVLLPHCQIPRYQGRPSYVVRPDGAILLFLTAKPTHAAYDMPLVFISFTGGCQWGLFSFMPGSDLYRTICPSPVVLGDGRIAVAVRCKLDVNAVWDELYVSDDGGVSWSFVSRINDHGDTVHLTAMKDGRLFAIYGFRLHSYGLRAKISEDGGVTWGPEIIVRDDGGSYDLGYPRAVELSDGSILASYYFNDRTDPVQVNGGVRYIAGTKLKV